jgi:O-antigen ligase
MQRMASRPGGLSAPDKIVFGSAWLYVAILIAITQPVGGPLMTIRWVALALFCLLGTLDLINDRGRIDRSVRSTGEALAAYLLLTLLTVVTAENWKFSGARWLTHAMALLGFLVYFRRCLTPERVSTLVLILKIVIGGVLIYSVVHPAPVRSNWDDPNRLRGTFGDANSFGQIAAFGAILYLHGGLHARAKNWHRLQMAAAAVSIGLVFRSGARSAVLQCLAAAAVMAFFDRRKLVIAVCFIIAVGGIIPLAFPGAIAGARSFIFKYQDETPGQSASLSSRLPSWELSWDAFKERPVAGWGFATDADIAKDAEVGASGLGIANRDGVSDLFRFLEGSGLVGLVAFALLIYLAIHDVPLAPRLIERLGVAFPFATSYDLHILFFAECVGFVVLVQVDNTLISAGNLIPTLAWMCAGTSGALATYCRRAADQYWRESWEAVAPPAGGPASRIEPAHFK